MDVGDDSDSQVACLGGRNDNRARRGRLVHLRLPAAADDVPGGLHLSGLDPHRFFSAAELARTERYERFVRIVVVLSLVAEVVALLVLTRRAPRIARDTDLGPIGAGMIVAAITLAVLWAVDLPFSLALRWWDQRHDLTEGSWVDWLVAPWAQLAGGVRLRMLQVAVVVRFARRSRAELVAPT